MDGGIAIVCLSVAMFVGCFIIGLIPLMIKLSEVSIVILLVYSSFYGSLAYSPHAFLPFIFVSVIFSGNVRFPVVYV